MCFNLISSGIRCWQHWLSEKSSTYISCRRSPNGFILSYRTIFVGIKIFYFKFYFTLLVTLVVRENVSSHQLSKNDPHLTFRVFFLLSKTFFLYYYTYTAYKKIKKYIYFFNPKLVGV